MGRADKTDYRGGVKKLREVLGRKPREAYVSSYWLDRILERPDDYTALFDRLKREAPWFVEDFKTSVGMLAKRERASAYEPLMRREGVYKRENILAKLADEMVIAERRGNPLSVMMIDLDGLKPVNDTYGHDVGDRVLCSTAGVMAGSMRPYEYLGRYGGDELLRVLPHTDKDDAVGAARVMGNKVRGNKIEHRGGITLVTLSTGIATFPYDADTPDELVKAADTAMYTVKKTTKDGVAAYNGTKR